MQGNCRCPIIFRVSSLRLLTRVMESLPGSKASTQLRALYSGLLVWIQRSVESEWSSTPHPDFRRGHQAMRLKRQPKLMLHHLQSGVYGGGAYRTNWDGEVVPLGKGYKKISREEVREKVWDHTMRAFQEISAGGHFSA
jgi:hypothetical protein